MKARWIVKYKGSLLLSLMLVLAWVLIGSFLAASAHAFYASEGDMQNIFSEGKLKAENALEKKSAGEDENDLSNTTSEVEGIRLDDMDSFFAELESLTEK